MRKYGQHFLKDMRVIDAIAAAVPEGLRNAVEIGPGRGALTEKLLKKEFENFTLVEIDPQMREVLLARWPELEGRIVLSDFLKFDLASLPARPTFFVSNLPYIDAAEILDKVLSWRYFSGAVFMFQKEQAQRILAKEGGEGYGPLSILSQLRAEVKPLLKVGKACFNPPPKVESMVLTFEKKETPFSDEKRWPKFARLVKAAFAHRRKTLFNSLSLCGFDKRRIQEALVRLQVPASARAEQISLETYMKLDELLG